MLDFLIRLEKILKVWPDNVKWNLIEVAEKTETSVPHVVEFFRAGTTRILDVHEPMSFCEASAIYSSLIECSRPQIEARRQKEMKDVEKAIDTFYLVMERVKVLEYTKKRRNAYRTLTYFFGTSQGKLPSEIIVSICNECLRLGIKEKVSFQENARWLNIGITTLLAQGDYESLEDALDFLDAYGEYFLSMSEAGGSAFLTNLFLTLKPSVMEYNLTPKFNEIAEDLNVTSVMDMVI